MIHDVVKYNTLLRFSLYIFNPFVFFNIFLYLMTLTHWKMVYFLIKNVPIFLKYDSACAAVL